MPPLTYEERQRAIQGMVDAGYAPDYATWCAGWANPAHPANQTRFAYSKMGGAL